jgi:hypothetical protein
MGATAIFAKKPKLSPPNGILLFDYPTHRINHLFDRNIPHAWI